MAECGGGKDRGTVQNLGGKPEELETGLRGKADPYRRI